MYFSAFRDGGPPRRARPDAPSARSGPPTTSAVPRASRREAVAAVAECAGAHVRVLVGYDSACGTRRARATPRPPHEDGGGDWGSRPIPHAIGSSSARTLKSARYGAGDAIKSRTQARDERTAAELK